MTRALLLLAGLFSLSTWANQSGSEDNYSLSVMAEDLAYPKAMVQLPNSRWLIALRNGSIVSVAASGDITYHTLQFPQLYEDGQGGVLDIELAADFTTSKRVLFSYSKGDADSNHLAVVSATLSDEANLFSEFTPVFSVSTVKDTPVHYGGKLLAINDNEWLLTSGDGFDYREQAQVLSSQLGKVLRFTVNGAPSARPPFPETPYVFTYGHRNPQGLIRLPNGGVLSHEHGPDGGDEVNVLTAGSNYGWPVVTLGKDYSGATISPFNHYQGMEDPLVNWTPSIAPSSMAYYSGQVFDDLHDQVLVTALKAKALYALDIAANPIRQKRVFPRLATRLRDVAVGNDGFIYVLTDGEEGQLIQITPPNNHAIAQR